MAGKKNEQSMLISLDSLTEDEPNQPAEGAVAPSATGKGLGEASGLIDLSALEGAGFTADPGASSGGTDTPGFMPASAVPVRARRKGSVGLVLFIVAGAVALVAGGIYVGKMLDEPTPAPAAGTAAAPAAGAAPTDQKPTPDKSAAAAAAATKPDAGAATAAAGADAGAKVGEAETDAGAKVAKAPPKDSKRPTRRAKRPAKPSPKPDKPAPAAEDAPKPAVAAAPKPAEAPAAKPKKQDEVDGLLSALDGKQAGAKAAPDPTAPANDPLLPERLDRNQILSVVRRNAAAVRKCKAEPPGTGGTVPVRMVIAGTGKVSSADVASGPAKGTAMGACVERTVKVFRFPQFRGDPMQITMPFAL